MNDDGRNVVDDGCVAGGEADGVAVAVGEQQAATAEGVGDFDIVACVADQQHGVGG